MEIIYGHEDLGEITQDLDCREDLGTLNVAEEVAVRAKLKHNANPILFINHFNNFHNRTMM
jgi:hypothetical protein